MKAMWLARQDVRRYLPSLSEQGALAELNYRRLLRLYAGQECDLLRLHTQDDQGKAVQLTLVCDDRQRYTRTLILTLHLDRLPSPLHQVELWLKLYDDVGCAEVVRPVSGKQLQPYYPTPNRQMFAMDEKTQLNLFLADWLQYCLRHGVKREYIGAAC